MNLGDVAERTGASRDTLRMYFILIVDSTRTRANREPVLDPLSPGIGHNQSNSVTIFSILNYRHQEHLIRRKSEIFEFRHSVRRVRRGSEGGFCANNK
jgi:hypothetical protein